MAWSTGKLPDLSGIAAYTILIRGEDDPDRKPRPAGGQKDKTPHRTIAKMDEGSVRRVLLRHLGDKVARTMNRIGVELWDKTADILFQTKVETILWQLVLDGLVEHTMQAPVLFRRTERRASVSNSKQKHTCPMNYLFDNAGGSNELRAKLKDGGAYTKKGVWVFTSEDQYLKTMELLGRDVSEPVVEEEPWKPAGQQGQRFRSDRENLANTPKAMPMPEADRVDGPRDFDEMEQDMKLAGNTVVPADPVLAAAALAGAGAGLPVNVALPSTPLPPGYTAGKEVRTQYTSEPNLKLPSTGAIVDTPVGPAAVVETGDVAAGGLLERDSEGRVQKLSLLQLKPNRLVCIETRVAGLRRRVTLGRRKEKNEGEEGRFGGMESVTTTTTSEQTIVLPEEHKRAEVLRSNLRGVLERMGATLKGGFIAVPLEQEGAFMEALAGVKQELKEFNAASQVWKVFIDATRYQAMGDDGENTARKMAYELKLLTDEVRDAIEAADTVRIQAVTRDMKAKSLALAPGQTKAAVEGAIVEARAVRSMLVREVETKGRAISEVKAQMRTDMVESTRLILEDFKVPEEISDVDMGMSGRLAGILPDSSDDDGGSDSDAGNADGGNGSVADAEQMGLGLAGRLEGVMPAVPS